MKEAFERFKISATGRWAVSIRIYVLTVPFAFAINLERENILNPGNFARSFSICLAGEFASYLYIFIAQGTLLKHRKQQLQRLSTCIFVWFSTGTVKGIFFIIYAVWAYGYEADFLARTILPTAFAGISGAILAFYFGTIDRKRIEAKALNSLNDFLVIDQGRSYENNAKIRNEFSKLIQETLMPQIEKLEQKLSGISQNFNQINAQYKSLLLESRKIADSIKLETDLLANNQNKMHTSDKTLRDAPFLIGLIPEVISVRITLLVVILGMTTGQMTRNGVLGVTSGLVGAAILGIVLIALRMYSKRLKGNKLKKFIALSYLIVFMTQVIYVSNLSRLGFNLENPYMPWYSGIKTIYGFYIASIIATLVVHTSNEIKKSTKNYENYVLNLQILEKEREVLAEHLFATKFGTIQGKITGLIMAIQLLTNQSEIATDSQKFKELMNGALKLLEKIRIEIEELNMELIIE